MSDATEDHPLVVAAEAAVETAKEAAIVEDQVLETAEVALDAARAAVEDPVLVAAEAAAKAVKDAALIDLTQEVRHLREELERRAWRSRVGVVLLAAVLIVSGVVLGNEIRIRDEIAFVACKERRSVENTLSEIIASGRDRRPDESARAWLNRRDLLDEALIKLTSPPCPRP